MRVVGDTNSDDVALDFGPLWGSVALQQSMRRGSSRQIMRRVSGLKPWEEGVLCVLAIEDSGEKVWAVRGTHLVRLHILQALDDCAKRRMVGRGNVSR